MLPVCDVGMTNSWTVSGGSGSDHFVDIIIGEAGYDFIHGRLMGHPDKESLLMRLEG